MGALLTKKELVIATLNYSGILYSPFQFFSSEMEKDEKKVSDTLKGILQQLVPNFDSKTFKWNLGKIDLKMQTERYTPIYRKCAGIQNGKLVNEKRFKEIWVEEFKKNVAGKNFPYTQQEMNNTLNFDLCCYKSIIQVVYKLKDLQKVNEVNPELYQNFMEKFFEKAFLNEPKKIQRVFSAIHQRKVDINFFQEVNPEFLQKIDRKQFYVSCKQGVESAIVIKKDKFKVFKTEEELFSKVDPELQQKLKWNDDTMLCFVDNLIIISGHLSSKKQKNAKQVTQMMESIYQLKEMFPKYQVIVGIDANSFIQPAKVKNGLHIYPESAQQHTTMKKRTWVQPQVSKAQELASCCRDHLITSVKMDKARVVTIGDKNWKQVKYIPTEVHPYDHFVVTANIEVVEED